MKFSTREDIEATADFVFAQVTDFQNYERQAMRRGADVRRIDSAPVPVAGSAWDVAFKYRGKDRKLRGTLARLDSPNLVQLDTVAAGLSSETIIELVPLSPKRTRLAVTIELKATSLSARLLLQSLKLAKTNLTKRFKQRVSEFATDVEDRASKNA